MINIQLHIFLSTWLAEVEITPPFLYCFAASCLSEGEIPSFLAFFPGEAEQMLSRGRTWLATEVGPE